LLRWFESCWPAAPQDRDALRDELMLRLREEHLDPARMSGEELLAAVDAMLACRSTRSDEIRAAVEGRPVPSFELQWFTAGVVRARRAG
jgi:hypothetical protein